MIKNGCLAIAVTVLMFAMAVVMTLGCKGLYYLDMKHLHIAEESGYAEDVIKENYDELIRYNLSPFQKELVLPDFPMSEEGRIHFREVRNIFQTILFLLPVSACITCLGVGMELRKRKEKRDFRFLKWAGFLTLFIPLVVGIFMAVSWEKTFIFFHNLMFQNDYWLFDPAVDPVILILPDTFFMHCAMMIAGLIAAGAILCLILGNHYNNA